MNNQTGLAIYKASAGSGKTFLLVGEYLRMLFANPRSYKNILAVTFTNKATAEMKERILKELAYLASGGKSKYPELIETYKSDQLISDKAGRILKLILHDYSRFSVMTIDSFFQRVIRSFAREIRLNASFKTEIDNKQPLEDAVDLLFQEIDTNVLLKSWMVQFLEENLEEGRSWDFKKELLKFGKEVEKEVFKANEQEFLDSLSSKEHLTAYIAEIKEMVSQIEERLVLNGKKGLEVIAAHGLNYDDLKGSKNSFANLFNKLINKNFDPPTKTALEARDQLENWYKKSDSQQRIGQIEELYANGLNQLLKETIEVLNKESVRLNSAKAILKNIYPFGLLGNIALKIKEVLNENNTILLSDSGRMIGNIIEGNDTPFIYEKVGMIYRHFMLDEFQDTSRQQWTNFKPLLENALGSGYSSLVVGDVKQSIYRWRNGDWNLLEHQVASDLAHQITRELTLQHNWRSKKNIVDFNNTLFWQASEALNTRFAEESASVDLPEMQGVILKAYGGHYQICSQSGDASGMVQIAFADMDGSKLKSDFQSKALNMLIEQLEMAQLSGVKPEEMSILVRENAEAELIARAFWERKKNSPQPGCIYDVITSDTLKVGQSRVVKFVVNLLQFLVGKEKARMRAEVLYTYYIELLPVLLPAEPSTSYNLYQLFDSNEPLPELFMEWLDEDPNSDFHSGRLALPLYELAVAICSHFRLGEILGEKVYLQTFLDYLLDFGKENGGGVPGFLAWWEATGSSKTLNLPSIPNFIRISSIHQSKGLEYPTVFIPFCNWETGLNLRKPTYLWALPVDEPFNHLKMVLLKCDNDLKQSGFYQEYYQELLFCMMDNLNLLYVSMTRAIQNLFVIMPWKEGLRQFSTVAELFQQILENPRFPDSIEKEKYIDFASHWDPVVKKFELGSLQSASERNSAPYQEVVNSPLYFNYDDNRLKIRKHSKDYFHLTGNHRSERINKGTIMHQIFEQIIVKSDVRPAVHRVVSSGLISKMEGEEFSLKIEALLQESPFSDWFSGNWRVLNEREILRVGATRHRPDRIMLQGTQAVVVDYKTGEKSAKDLKQVQGYLDDMQKMGYETVFGFIWYLHNNEVVAVN